MALTFVAAPRVTALTTPAAVRDQMVDVGPESDPLLTTLIKVATAAILQHTNKDFARCQVRETVKGYGFTRLLLSRTPVLALTQMLYQGDVLTDFTIEDPEAGALYRRLGADWTRQYAWGTVDSYPMPDSEEPAFTATYWAGYLLPGDDVLSESLSATAGTNTYALASGTFPLLIAGDTITVDGFTTAANNGVKAVVSRATDGASIVVSEVLVNEAAVAGTTRTVAARTLPDDLEQAAVETVKALYSARGRDPAVAERQVGDLRITYRSPTEISGETSAALPLVATALLSHYVRVRQ